MILTRLIYIQLNNNRKHYIKTLLSNCTVAVVIDYNDDDIEGNDGGSDDDD